MQQTRRSHDTRCKPMWVPRRWEPWGPVIPSSWRRTSLANLRPRGSRPASSAHFTEKPCSCHACCTHHTEERRQNTERKTQDYTFRRHFGEKPSVILDCSGGGKTHCSLHSILPTAITCPIRSTMQLNACSTPIPSSQRADDVGCPQQFVPSLVYSQARWAATGADGHSVLHAKVVTTNLI